MLMVHSGMAAMTGAGLGGYDAWLAHIAALATSGHRNWYQIGWDEGLYRSTAYIAAQQELYGSPWGAQFSRDYGHADRVAQHGLPTYDVFMDQKNNGRQLFFRITYAPDYLDEPSVTRNNFTSNYGDPGYAKRYCEEILYWYQDAAWRMNPRLMQGPFPYTGHLT